MSDWKIVDAARAVPERIVTNDDLSRLMETSDDWIRTRTGIRRRHISDGENTSDLAARVANELLTKNGWDADSLDLVIVATMTPDAYTPATAARVQAAIGAYQAIAFDVSSACTGFIYALSVAGAMLSRFGFHRALVIGSEVLSKLVDWHDRSTAVLFGDGAGGVLLETTASSHVIGWDLATFGQLGGKIVAGQTNVAADFPRPVSQLSPFSMDGRAVYKFATHQVPASIDRAAADAGISLDQVDHFLLHQANARIVRQVAKRLGQPLAKFPINIDDYGNTAAASEPILLADCVASGEVQRGDILALSGFGGGLSTGTVIIKY